MRYGTRHCFRRAPPDERYRSVFSPTPTVRLHSETTTADYVSRDVSRKWGETERRQLEKNNRNLTLRLPTIRHSTNERPARPESRPLTVSPLLWKLPVGRGFKTSRLLPRARPFGSFRLLSAIIDGTPTIQLMQIQSRVAAVSISPKMVCTRFYLVPVQIHVSSCTLRRLNSNLAKFCRNLSLKAEVERCWFSELHNRWIDMCICFFEPSFRGCQCLLTSC